MKNKVYALLDMNMDVFYVGITSRKIQERMRTHIRDAVERKTPTHIFINNLIMNGGTLKALLLETLSSNDMVTNRKEGFWIREMIKQGYKLTNVCGTIEPKVYDIGSQKEIKISDNEYFNNYQPSDIKALLSIENNRVITLPRKHSPCFL